MAAPDFDSAAAREACQQLQQMFRDCGFPCRTVSMQVNATDTDATVLVTWDFTGPPIEGKRWKFFRAESFRGCFVAANAWLTENSHLTGARA